jgi:hypothetical protein
MGCVVARALVISPEALALVRQLGANGPGPWFYRLCRAMALCGKRSILSDLIFGSFYQEKEHRHSLLSGCCPALSRLSAICDVGQAGQAILFVISIRGTSEKSCTGGYL